MMSFTSLMAALLACAAAPGPPSPAPDAPRFPTLVMEDQFARPRKLSDLRGDVVVLVFSDRGGAEASRDLGARLHVQFHPTARGQSPAQAAQAPPAPIANWPADLPLPDAKMIAVAVIGDVPGAMRPMVRYRFRQVSPDGVIWLDFYDAMRKQFQVVPEVPNVAVLDKAGQVRYVTSGKPSEPEFEQLVSVIEALRQEPPVTTATGARQDTRLR